MPDHVYVYPGYLSKGGSRSDGRRVPAELAVGELTLEELVAAAVRLGYKAEAEPEKNYPRLAHEFAGRVKITKRAGTSKTQLLRQLAEELVRQRGGAKGSA
jgi:signal recognition particle subunit SRP19